MNKKYLEGSPLISAREYRLSRTDLKAPVQIKLSYTQRRRNQSSSLFISSSSSSSSQEDEFIMSAFEKTAFDIKPN